MIPDNFTWPFRVAGDFIEFFDRRHFAWVIPKGNPDNVGYIMINWSDSDHKRNFKRAHVVCWVTHNGPVPPGLELDHIDGDKANNRITNLRLVTHAENLRFARERLGNWSPRKLSGGQMALVLAMPPEWRCLHALAKRWGVSKFTLGNIRAKAKRSYDRRYMADLEAF